MYKIYVHCIDNSEIIYIYKLKVLNSLNLKLREFSSGFESRTQVVKSNQTKLDYQIQT